MLCFSVLDIVSDITLFFDYLLGREYITEYVFSNDTSLDPTNRILGNITIWSCTMMNTTCSEEGPMMIACKWRDPWWAIFTLIFIYLPSFFVIAALYGPKKAGMVTSVESIFIREDHEPLHGKYQARQLVCVSVTYIKPSETRDRLLRAKNTTRLGAAQRYKDSISQP